MNDKEALKVAKEAAIASGALLKQLFGKISTIREKSSAGDLVTEADTLSESTCLALIKEYDKDIPIITEESGYHKAKDKRYLWAIDPLDGTTNYAHTLPLFAVSIALIKDGTPIVGVIYNPIHKELFAATASAPATLNDIPIEVSTISELKKSLLATGFAYDRLETQDNNYPEFCSLTDQTQGVRRMGSAALDLAYVACGRLDGFWERGLNIWDIAAGALIVRQAGGKVSSYENGPLELESGRILASNGLLHTELSRALMR